MSAATKRVAKDAKAERAARAKVITQAQANELKAAIGALPKTLATDPGKALEAAQKIVGIALDANPVRLTNLGISTVDAAGLAHGSLTVYDVLAKFGAARAGAQDLGQASANLAELQDAAPKQALREPVQHKLSAKKAPAPKAEDPKVVERRGMVTKRHVEAKDLPGEHRAATDKEAAALDLAEKRWIADGPQWSTNGYRCGTSALDPKGASCYVFVDDDGVSHLMQKSPDGSRWVLDMIEREGADGPVTVWLIDEPAAHKSYYGLLEEWGEGYDSSKDKRKKGAKSEPAKTRPAVEVNPDALPEPVAQAS